MTEDDLIRMIAAKSGDRVLAELSAMSPRERRRHAGAVIRFYKAVMSFWQNDPNRPSIRDDDAAMVAVLAVATLTELKSLRFAPIPRNLAIQDVLRTLSPDWITEWVTHLIDDNPNVIGRISPVWEAGLCPRPSSEAFILGYYVNASWRSMTTDQSEFLSHDVWRFFEVEGGGEFSLAAHDKYANASRKWSVRLLSLLESGKLDHERLLDATLDALERDFAQFRAGWYSRFHGDLNPTIGQMTERAARYLRLLSSGVPPTVSLALKAVQKLDKAGAIAPDDLLPALEAPLQARQKSTVTTALRLLDSAVKRDTSLASEAAHLATRALVAETADIQSKALDLIEKLGGNADPAIRSELADFAPLAAASVAKRIASMADVDLGAKVELPEVPGPAMAARFEPVADAIGALELFLSVLEAPRDPLEIERAIDGVSRFGAALRADEALVSPLRKRARQIAKRDTIGDLQLSVALTGCALAEGKTFAELEIGARSISSGTFARVFHDRNAEMIGRVLSTRALPMLSMPSDRGGFVAPDALVERLGIYRAACIEPGTTDLSLALLRLASAFRLCDV